MFIYIISVILVAVSLGIYIGFVTKEGNDERGQAILAKSSQIAFIFILVGFVFQGVYFQFFHPSVEQVRIMISVWMALVFVGNGMSILVYRRRM